MIDQIAGFLRGIGLTVEFASIAEPCFLPGLTVRGGVLVVDREKCLYPGDMLHEAGHIATLTPAQRLQLNGDAGVDPGMEMAAIAWSYAAALEAGVPLEVLFHEAGYKGGAQSLAAAFQSGSYIGAPMLSWFGMAAGVASDPSVARYPKMLHWLRQEEESGAAG